MNTPSPHTIPGADAVAALDGIAETCGQLRLLLQEAQVAAALRDGGDLADIAERILPLQVEFARRYRSWLARRLGPGPGSGMSI
jgi:hypothetical protein